MGDDSKLAVEVSATVAAFKEQMKSSADEIRKLGLAAQAASPQIQSSFGGASKSADGLLGVLKNERKEMRLATGITTMFTRELRDMGLTTSATSQAFINLGANILIGGPLNIITASIGFLVAAFSEASKSLAEHKRKLEELPKWYRAITDMWWDSSRQLTEATMRLNGATDDQVNAWKLSNKAAEQTRLGMTAVDAATAKHLIQMSKFAAASPTINDFFTLTSTHLRIQKERTLELTAEINKYIIAVWNATQTQQMAAKADFLTDVHKGIEEYTKSEKAKTEAHKKEVATRAATEAKQKITKDTSEQERINKEAEDVTRRMYEETGKQETDNSKRRAEIRDADAKATIENARNLQLALNDIANSDNEVQRLANRHTIEMQYAQARILLEGQTAQAIKQIHDSELIESARVAKAKQDADLKATEATIASTNLVGDAFARIMEDASKTGAQKWKEMHKIAVMAIIDLCTKQVEAYAISTAGAAAFSQAGIPVIGPILMVGAALAAGALVRGLLANMPSAEGGWSQTREGVMYTHDNEMHLDAKHADVIDRLADQSAPGGAPVIINVSALDAKSFDQRMWSGRNTLVRIIRDAQRRNQ